MAYWQRDTLAVRFISGSLNGLENQPGMTPNSVGLFWRHGHCCPPLGPHHTHKMLPEAVPHPVPNIRSVTITLTRISDPYTYSCLCSGLLCVWLEELGCKSTFKRQVSLFSLQPKGNGRGGRVSQCMLSAIISPACVLQKS